MDYNKDGSSAAKPVSVLQGDGFYFDKIMSRASSAGQSSRIYYRGAEGVPFKWEMQPGTPKNNPAGATEVMAPLNPPPAVQSLGLPLPSLDDQPHKAAVSALSKGWLWRKLTKIRRKRKVAVIQTSRVEETEMGAIHFESLECRDSDRESPLHDSTSSSSSSSSSSSNGPPLGQPLRPQRSDVLEPPFGCSPWNITEVLVCAARRN